MPTDEQFKKWSFNYETDEFILRNVVDHATRGLQAEIKELQTKGCPCHNDPLCMESPANIWKRCHSAEARLKTQLGLNRYWKESIEYIQDAMEPQGNLWEWRGDGEFRQWISDTLSGPGDLSTPKAGEEQDEC